MTCSITETIFKANNVQPIHRVSLERQSDRDLSIFKQKLRRKNVRVVCRPRPRAVTSNNMYSYMVDFCYGNTCMVWISGYESVSFIFFLFRVSRETILQNTTKKYDRIRNVDRDWSLNLLITLIKIFRTHAVCYRSDNEKSGNSAERGEKLFLLPMPHSRTDFSLTTFEK